MRRSALSASVAVLASVIAVPLIASPASAAVAPVEKAFVSVDTGSGYYGLHVRTTPDGALGPSLTAATVDVEEVAASADGSRIATVESTYDANDYPLAQRVVVRDVSGRLVRTLDTLAFDGDPGHVLSGLALSPDGTRAVWSRPGYDLHTALVGSGAATPAGPNLAHAAFVDATTVLGFEFGAKWHTQAVGGDVTVPATGIPNAAYSLAVSPDHSHVAWTQETSPGAGTFRLYSATLTVTPGAGPSSVAATSPLLLAQGIFPDAPAFSRDGSTIYYVDGDTTGELRRVPTNASTASSPVDGISIGDVLGSAVAATDDGTPPGTVTPLPASVTSTTASVRWALPSGADLSGIVVTRKLGTTTQKSAYVPAPATSWSDTGLTSGATYTYSFQAVDRTNNYGAASSWQVVPTAALPVTFSDPTSTASTKSSFVVTMPSAAPTGTTFKVEVLASGTSTWKSWVTGSTSRTQLFGSPARTGVLASTSVAGKSYTFRVTYGVSHGNTTAWANSARAVVPFDQTKATLYGGLTGTASYAYLGSYRRLSKTTDYARLAFLGNRLQVIGTKCASCGGFNLYDGGSLVGVFDTYSSSTKARQVLATLYLNDVSAHTFTVKPRATSGRPYVFLDGFAMRT